MRRLVTLCWLLFIAVEGYSQVTIYYDDHCNITMREIATHYRIAKVDTVLKKFIGEVKDFSSTDTLMMSLTYDTQGVKDVTTVAINDAQLKSNQIIVPAEECLTKKEAFAVSPFVRKRDYPDIYSLIPVSPPSYDKRGIWTIVEEGPEFPNGMQMLGQFIGVFIKYPDEAVKNNIKGQVVVGFTISKDGSTTDFKIIKGLGYGCDEEAVRVLKLLPDWRPGYQRGKAVQTRFKLPITFQ